MENVYRKFYQDFITFGYSADTVLKYLDENQLKIKLPRNEMIPVFKEIMKERREMIAEKEQNAKQYKICNRKFSLAEEREIFDHPSTKIFKFNNNTHPVSNFKNLIPKTLLSYKIELNKIFQKRRRPKKPLHRKKLLKAIPNIS